MTTTTFRCKNGDFELLRRPPTPHLPLQAWDAADEYLLSGMAGDVGAETNVLVINDQFGALAIACSAANVCSWGDSYTAHCATLDNFARNRLDSSRLVLLPSTELPAERFDHVLWRIPKTLRFFQQQARALQTCVGGTAVVLASGMQKHLPPRTLELLRAFGEIETFPTLKKARLFAIRLHRDGSDGEMPGAQPLKIAEHDLSLHAGPNVFARDTFDIGTRFFIEQFSQLPRAGRIADLGCGNGLLGLRVKQLQAEAQVEFFDESYQAIAAAKKNYAANGLSLLAPDAHFHSDDIFSHYAGEPFDLILCNPPFHQGHVVGDHIAWQMFMQSKSHLRGGGELWIVGNRHLDYHIKLKKIFGNCRQIAAHAKFVVLAARLNA